MKKVLYLLVIVAALLPCSVIALAASNSPAESNNVKNEVIQFNGTEVSVSDSIVQLSKNDALKSCGIQINQANTSSTEMTLINQEEAITVAIPYATAKTSDDAESINASLVQFSDTECPVLPESNIKLTDVTAWVVTFHNVEVMRHGPSSAAQEAQTVQADVHVIVDAETGAWLETVCCTAQK